MFIIYNNIKLLLCWHQWFCKISSFYKKFKDHCPSVYPYIIPGIKTIVGPVKGLMNRMNGVCWLCHPILEFFNFDIEESLLNLCLNKVSLCWNWDTSLLNLLDLCSIDIKMEDCHRRPWPGQHNGVVTPGQCEYVWCEQIGIRAQHYTTQCSTPLASSHSSRYAFKM